MQVIKSKIIKMISKFLIPFVLIPFLLILASFVFNGKRYLIISIGIVVLSLILFFIGFEKKNLGSRRMVIVSVITALSVVGRFLPFFQPITALTIITAVYIGSDSGFLVGALSAFLSNFYFGQGPWTPFQMFAWGMIGLLAGYLSKPLSKSKWLMIIYGIIAGVAYSLIMDVWSTVWYNGEFNLTFYKAAIITAMPHTVMYCISNFIFLFICAEPFGKKFIRIKTKYGI